MKVLFDLGNVVLNWDTRSIVQGLQIDEPKQTLVKKELFGHRDWLDFDRGLVTEQELIGGVAKRSGLDIPALEHCLLQAKKSLIEIEATIELMTEIHSSGIEMYCLSNMPTETFDYIKSRSFFNFFSGVVISGNIKMMKPEPEIFSYTLNRFNLSAGSTLFVDDSLANIMAAEKMGISCVHFKRTDDCYRKIRNALEL